jgi:anti-sigma factor RsiW
MTDWTIKQERHIPEDELHAYLDQALSRSQCAEIETHLSACKLCQSRRSAVAALRDRTTALLSGLAPRPVIVPPSFQDLRERQSRRLALAVWRARLQRSSLWAAGVVAAVGAGWVARTLLDPHRTAVSPPLVAQSTATPPPAPLASAPAVDSTATAEIEKQATPAPLPQRSVVVATHSVSATHSSRALVPAPTLQLASIVTPIARAAVEGGAFPLARPAGINPFDRVWRIVPWEDALQIAGSELPFIEGIPVVGVMFQPGAPGERPTVIVAQQDQNGEVIQSIEGPVARVNELRSHQPSDVHASDIARTAPDYVDGPGGMRRALRILTVIGKLPVDSLNALARVATIR